MRGLIIKSSLQTNEMFELHWFEKRNGYKHFFTKILVDFFPNGIKMEIDKLHSKNPFKKVLSRRCTLGSVWKAETNHFFFFGLTGMCLFE